MIVIERTGGVDMPEISGLARAARRSPLLSFAGILLAAAPALAASPPVDGIGLTVVPSAIPPRDLTLSWSGGGPPYLVFRSGDPAAIVSGTTRIATTAASTLDVPGGVATIDYFLVVNVDATSPVTSTSDCLTAGTGAEAAVVVELRDSQSRPLPGAAVGVVTDQGAVGPVDDAAGTYRTVLTPPAAAAGPATVSVTAEGVALSAEPSVAVEDPLTGTGGGAGGCPADGNLRVRVVDEAGLPLAGANVMSGLSESPALYETTPGSMPDGSNTGVSGPDGYVEFRDFGANLDGPQTITAAAAGRRYLTLADVDAADVVLPLAQVDPPVAAETFSGDITNVPAPSNDPIELAFLLPDVELDDILSFSLSELLADSECYAAGGAVGDAALPANVYIPSQCALQIIFCLQTLPEHPYTSAPVPYGDRKLLALRGGVPLSALAAGDFNVVLSSLALNGIGVVDRTASVPGPTALDLPITDALAANLSCSIDNAPANSDVFCIGAGDWDSGFDPGLPIGAGRLFVTGFRLGDAAGATEPFSIAGVTTTTATGDFAGIEYLGVAVAQYNDPAKPGIPAGTEDGTSVILDRSGTTFDGTGGLLTFDDFFPVRTLARVARDFSLGALPGVGHPPPHLTRVELDQVVTETYSACAAGDSTRVRRLTLWQVLLPGSTDSWTLPTPPVGWPRQDAGGDLAGLVDPALTPEDDALEQAASTFHVGTLTAFDYNRLQFDDLRLHLTHVTRNVADY